MCIRDSPKIEVTFDIDANGIVSVSAKDMGTGKEQSIRIESATSLSEDEIQQKISEAEQFAAEDEERQKKVELRNTADNIVYQTRRTLKEAGDKLEGEDTSAVEDKLTELEAMIRTDEGPVSDDDLDEEAIQAKVQESWKKPCTESQPSCTKLLPQTWQKKTRVTTPDLMVQKTSSMPTLRL